MKIRNNIDLVYKVSDDHTGRVYYKSNTNRLYYFQQVVRANDNTVSFLLYCAIGGGLPDKDIDLQGIRYIEEPNSGAVVDHNLSVFLAAVKRADIFDMARRVGITSPASFVKLH
jgi:hypothetical protein